MLRKAFFLAVALLLPALSYAQVKLLRHPTYSKGKVAFSYLGDHLDRQRKRLRRAAPHRQHRRATVFPRFSPDGNWIAFSSNREGNYDVYVIPATGGKPRQLTFHSADDNVVGWTPDGKNIIFTSAARQRRLPHASPRSGKFPPTAASSGPSPPIGAPGPATRPMAPRWPSPATPPSGRASTTAAAMRPTSG